MVLRFRPLPVLNLSGWAMNLSMNLSGWAMTRLERICVNDSEKQVQYIQNERSCPHDTPKLFAAVSAAVTDMLELGFGFGFGFGFGLRLGLGLPLIRIFTNAARMPRAH